MPADHPTKFSTRELSAVQRKLIATALLDRSAAAQRAAAAELDLPPSLAGVVDRDAHRTALLDEAADCDRLAADFGDAFGATVTVRVPS